MESLSVYIAKEERATANVFMELYTPYVYQGTKDNNIREAKRLKAQTQTCRFCKKGRGEVKFKQKTHLILKLLGNQGYYSHDECDTYNGLFRLRENDLAHYLGTSRTFDHILPDEDAHNFESANLQVGIKKLGIESFLIDRKKDGNEFNVDIKNGAVAVTLDSKPYRPDYVYLSLLKMALGMLPHEDVAAYYIAFKFLQHPDNYPEFNYVQRVCVTETSIVIGRPFALLFQKQPTVNNVNLPQHLFCLYLGRFMFQIMLPGHIADIEQIGKNFTFAIAPYVQLNTVNAHNDIVEKRHVENLWTTQKQKKKHDVNMGLPTDSLVGINVGTDFMEELLKGKVLFPDAKTIRK